ncbi:unnamed protein product [Lota lota]
MKINVLAEETSTSAQEPRRLGHKRESVVLLVEVVVQPKLWIPAGPLAASALCAWCPRQRGAMGLQKPSSPVGNEHNSSSPC